MISPTHRRLRLLVAEDPQLDLARVESLFHHDLAVVFEGEVDRLVELLRRLTLLTPTLEPRLAGFTNRGSPSGSTTSRTCSRW